MKPILLSVIVVTWNTRDLTTDCVNSIKKSLGDIPAEIIVIDNASDDGTDVSLGNIKGITYIKNPMNYGFSKANNIGIRLAAGEYILLLNSDTEVNPLAVRLPLEYLSKEPTIGVLGCKLLNGDGTTQISCAKFPSLRNKLFFSFLNRVASVLFGWEGPTSTLAYPNQNYGKLFFPDWILGAYMLIRREALLDVGLLDENTFMYGEDIDYCYRFWKRGWKVVHFPFAAITHFGGQSSIQTPLPTLERQARGVFLFLEKTKGRLYARFYSFFDGVFSLLQALLTFIARGDSSSDGFRKQFAYSMFCIRGIK